jgi:hypothetical protein
VICESFCLIRYTARGAVSLECLEADANGDLLYTVTRPWSDGATGITLSPLAWLEKLAALRPLPRMHLVRYGGCLALHSQLRRLVTPTPRQQGVEAPAASLSPRWGWIPTLCQPSFGDFLPLHEYNLSTVSPTRIIKCAVA